MILFSEYYDAQIGTLSECRLTVSASSFTYIANAANIAALILFTYMSVIFSKPLTGYWENFLLIYRTNELTQAV